MFQTRFVEKFKTQPFMFSNFFFSKIMPFMG